MPMIFGKHRDAAAGLKVRLYGDASLLNEIPTAIHLPDLQALRNALRPEAADPADDPGAPLLLIADMPTTGTGAWLAEFESVCGEIRRSTAPSHTILRHDGIPAGILSRLYRCGLNDAVEAAEGRNGLDAAIASGRQAVSDRLERLGLLQEQQRSGETLRASQANLRKQVANAARELASANQRLDMANQQLTRHMSQLSLLYSFGRELSTARNWDQALEQLLKNLADFVRARGAALVLRPAADAPYTPRKTYQWRESSWEGILRSIDDNRPTGSAAGGSGPDIFHFRETSGDTQSRITALPLNHRGFCLGYLLLLGLPEDEDGLEFLPLLNALQLIIADEVASAQMLDRMRELSVFNSRVLETVHSGIWVIDEFARTIYCNRVGREMLSGKPAQPRIVEEPHAGVGRGRGPDGNASMAEFFRREAFSQGPARELFLDGLLQLPEIDGLPLRVLADAGQDGWLGEGRLQRDDGSLLPVLVQSSHMHGRGRDEKWLVVVLEDQREAKRLAAEKTRADKLQSMVEMSSTLAHEIRNPLMGLSAQAELLAGTLPPDDSRGRYIDVIISEVERIDRTITGMLDFTRPCRPKPEAADLGRLLGDSAALLAPRAEKARVLLQVDLEGIGTDRPQLDDAQIKQVLLNLLCNAIDAAPKGSTVRLSACTGCELSVEDPRTGLLETRRGTLIEVEDEGKGFPAADRDAIFRPFFTTKTAGTGLGLPLSRKIVEAHGGALDAERRANRTIFRIQLPETVPLARTTSVEECS